MEDKNRSDVTKSIERNKLLNSYAKEKTFDLVDKTAKGLSTLKEEYLDKKDSPTPLDNNDLNNQEDVISEEAVSNESRLKTSETTEEIDDAVSEKVDTNTSNLKTNIANDQTENIGTENTKKSESRLKTAISKKITTTFGFKENQGKISKSITVASKVGKETSKIGRKITRASKDLDTAISSDGTGKDYLKTKAERKGKKVINNKVVKPITKPIKKATKKITAPITKKLTQALKIVMKKAIKLIVSVVCAIPEIIIPLAIVIFIVAFTSSIFGGSGKTTVSSYQNYMKTVQESYDKEVDQFLKENPDGLVFGVRGNYGKIDWRVPLAIMQGTGAEISLDNSEKTLLEKFKEADLFEKHIILEKTTTTGYGETETKTTKMLVILNAGMDEYLEWCNKNFSHIKTFLNSKRVTSYSTNSFDSLQLELINSLYTSDNFFDEFDSQYKDITIKYGSNNTPQNLSSDNYNSKNTLTTSGYKGQCTWYSFGRSLESMNKKTPTTNAETWLSNGIALGYQTGTQPHPNSIAVQVGTKSGHVAYIESYEGGKITVSEGNVGNACSGDETCSQVEYAKNHANELVRTKTYNSFLEYKKSVEANGKYLVGFLYLD